MPQMTDAFICHDYCGLIRSFARGGWASGIGTRPSLNTSGNTPASLSTNAPLVPTVAPRKPSARRRKFANAWKRGCDVQLVLEAVQEEAQDIGFALHQTV